MKRALFGLLILAAGFFSPSLRGDDALDHAHRRWLGATLRGVTSDAVAQAATTSVLTRALIFGPASISPGTCTRFAIVAIDQNNLPMLVTQNVPVYLKLFSAASATFSSNRSCSNSQIGFSIAAGANFQTFYATDSKVESFQVRPILNPATKPIVGIPFTFNFASGLNLTYWQGCWNQTGGSEYQALDFQLASPATLILQGELYNGKGCVATNWSDQLNDSNTPISFGGFGYIYWFTHRANITDVSVVWTFSDTSNTLLWSSGCVDYSTAPVC